MEKNSFIKQMGFNVNPFQYYNADQELKYIEQYFIEPPYFEDIWWDYDNPISSIVYAPRWTWKSTQRIMMENRAKQWDEVLWINYSEHDLSNIKSLEEIDINYHLINLNRILLLSLLWKIANDNKDYKKIFSPSERDLIFQISKIYLYDLPDDAVKIALESIKTKFDIVKDYYQKFSSPLSELFNAAVKRFSWTETNIKLWEVKILDKYKRSSHKLHFLRLKDLLIDKLWFHSIYILIDKIDEQSLTWNDPKKSFKFIESLISNLELLETPKIWFKFFLWDRLKEHVWSSARQDRVQVFNLKWTFDDILSMLNKRVSTYSEWKVESILKICENQTVLWRSILFSELSPRDLIRIFNNSLTEQNKIDDTSTTICLEALNQWIEHFITQKIDEYDLNQNSRRYLKKCWCASFSIESLVRNKVASNASSIRNIINPWNNIWISKKTWTTKWKWRLINSYAFQDIRIARFACSNIWLDDFILKKVRKCKSCSKFYYRNFDESWFECPDCNELN